METILQLMGTYCDSLKSCLGLNELILFLPTLELFASSKVEMI